VSLPLYYHYPYLVHSFWQSILCPSFRIGSTSSNHASTLSSNLQWQAPIKGRAEPEIDMHYL
jgi:hypothetical protein